MNRRLRPAALAVFCFCATFIAMPVRAQTPEGVPAGPLTLEQVLALAEARSEAIGISRAGIQRAEGEQVRARSGLFPQLSASASYDRALTSEFSGLFDTVDSGTGTDDSGFEDLPFGRANTWRISLALSQNLYSGGRLPAQADVAEAGRASAALGLTTTRAQLLFDVTQAYYDLALSDRLVRIAEATREQAGATLRQTQAGFDAGTQPEFEVIRARVARDSQTPLVIRQRANREVALLRHTLRDARRNLTEHMDVIERSMGSGSEPAASGSASGVGAEVRQTSPVRRIMADATLPDAARGSQHPCRVTVQRPIERRSA